jgi:hypothetical protein
MHRVVDNSAQHRSTAGNGPATGWHRHFEGWQTGAVLVISAAVAALLIVPHAQVSQELPLPVIDRLAERRAMLAEQELAAQARNAPLPYEVRAVGEAIRRQGALRAGGDMQAAEWSASDVRDAAQQALTKHGPQPLLQLRALQLQMFLGATTEFKLPAGQDVRELGGEFLELAKGGGWIEGDRLLADPAELRAWFVIRWGALAHLTEMPAFAPTLTDWRTYYTFLLRPDHHPHASDQELLDYRVRVIGALAQHDPDYPLDLALGILATQRGDYGAAASSLRRFLQGHPEGPWVLRARNTLKATGSYHASNQR